jgi:hypothetical protein
MLEYMHLVIISTNRKSMLRAEEYTLLNQFTKIYWTERHRNVRSRQVLSLVIEFDIKEERL